VVGADLRHETDLWSGLSVCLRHVTGLNRALPLAHQPAHSPSTRGSGHHSRLPGRVSRTPRSRCHVLKVRPLPPLAGLRTGAFHWRATKESNLTRRGFGIRPAPCAVTLTTSLARRHVRMDTALPGSDLLHETWCAALGKRMREGAEFSYHPSRFSSSAKLPGVVGLCSAMPADRRIASSPRSQVFVRRVRARRAPSCMGARHRLAIGCSSLPPPLPTSTWADCSAFAGLRAPVPSGGVD
jgi:hypothetical protein